MIRRSSDKYLLSSNERSAAVDLVEKEKFLRDVYIELATYWSQPALVEEARIKNKHLSSLYYILIKYNLTNPIQNLDIGEFSTTTMQNYFDNQVATGKETAYKGLRTLGFFEEKNIELLTPYISNTDKPLVKTTLKAIREDSFKALSKIAARIEIITGTDYVAQVLTQAQVDFILGKA